MIELLTDVESSTDFLVHQETFASDARAFLQWSNIADEGRTNQLLRHLPEEHVRNLTLSTLIGIGRANLVSLLADEYEVYEWLHRIAADAPTSPP